MVGDVWARTGWVAAGTAVVLAFAGWFEAARSAPRGPDIELGRYLATECITCHRRGGQTASGQAVPNIFGMAEPAFIQAVKAYRAKDRPNDVMQSVAARLKDDEIEALAAFFARTRQ